MTLPPFFRKTPVIECKTVLINFYGLCVVLDKHLDIWGLSSCCVYIIIPGDLKNLVLDRCTFFTLILSLVKNTLGLSSPGRCRKHRREESHMPTDNWCSVGTW